MKANKSNVAFIYFRLFIFYLQGTRALVEPRLGKDRPMTCRGIAAGA
jgi:hypothetical protein